MNNDSRMNYRIAIWEWTPNQMKRGWDALKVYDKDSNNPDRIFGDVTAFMIERQYPKTKGFSRQLMRMFFWEDIKRIATEEAGRMFRGEVDANGEKIAKSA